jgi:uncharacterized protein (UPF0333 family)
MSKKSQTSTEYIIILAVVIIIALIIVGALGGIPGIGRSSSSRATAAYWSSADVAITDYAFDNDGNKNVIKLRNNLRNQITVNNVTIGGTDLISGVAHTINSGETKNLTTASDKDCGDVGDSYSYDVNIVYVDKGTGATYTFTGDGNNLEGICSD